MHNTEFKPHTIQAFIILKAALERRRYKAIDHLTKKYSKLYPEHAGYFQHLTCINYGEQGKLEQAINFGRQANIYFQGHHLGVLLTLIPALREKKLLGEAYETVSQAINNFPEEKTFKLEYAKIIFEQGKMQAAVDYLQELCKTEPDFYEALVFLADYSFQNGNYQQSMEYFEECHKLAPANLYAWSTHIFYAHYVPFHTEEQLQTLLARWHTEFCKILSTTSQANLTRNTDPERIIKIGFIASNFRLHPVGWMTIRSLELLSQGKYSFIFYNTDAEVDDDPLRLCFKRIATCWHDVHGLDDADLYRKILDDKLDIAVDLSGHANGNKLFMFIQRIAPIQVKWVGGLFNSTGVKNMDYLLSDKYQTPKGADKYYTEKIVRLPNSYISFVPPDYRENLTLEINRQREHVCFGCFNNAHKINPTIIEVWAGILKRVPNSTLYIKDNKLRNAELCDRIILNFATFGIEKERLRLEGPSIHNEFLACYNKVDIALDTWPYTGGLTTLEAMFMGVPTITTPGLSFAGRHASSHMANLGLEEFICADFKAYAELAVQLAANTKALEELRLMLRFKLLNSKLTDHAQLAADLDLTFSTMWQRHCEGLPPIAMSFEQETEIKDEFKPTYQSYQIKQNIDSPEFKAMFEDILSNQYLHEHGWFRSHIEQKALDRKGRPLPWMNYSIIDLLESKVPQQVRVFEYGSGYGSLWWAERAKELVVVEHDKSWYDKMQPEFPNHVTAIYQELIPDDAYCRTAVTVGGKFDIIVIDGRDRVNCAFNCLPALNPDGIIIFDDTERQRYMPGRHFLKARGFKELQLSGLKPMMLYSSSTASLFYRPNNILDL